VVVVIDALRADFVLEKQSATGNGQDQQGYKVGTGIVVFNDSNIPVSHTGKYFKSLR
jgi:hypothetical protein